MSNGAEIRRYESGDRETAIQLLAGKVPATEQDAAFQSRLARWKWHYDDNPNNPDGKPLIWLVQMEGKIVGLVGAIPVRVRTPRGIVPAVWGHDAIVDPAVRGTGLGKKLFSAWLSSAPITLGRSFSHVTYVVSLKVGFKAVWGFTTAYIVLSRTRFALWLHASSRRRDLMRLAGVLLLPNARLERTGASEATVTDRVPAGAGALWSSVAGAYGFAVERDERYLNWRFASHPKHRYYYVQAGSSDRPSGLAIVRITADRHPLGVISDLIVDPESADAVGALMRASIAFLRSEGACAVLVDLPPALARTALAAYRCRLTGDLGMVVYTSEPGFEAEGIYDPGRWYLSRSDSDADY